MNKLAKVMIGITGAAGSLVVVTVAALLANSERKLNRHVHVPVRAVPYATQPSALEHGRYLYLSRCGECHGSQGEGRVFLDADNGMRLAGANLTSGRGSAVSKYTEVDWVRAIRHGVKPDGRPTFVMPSEDFNRLSDADLAALVAYIRALPPQDGREAEIRLPLVVRLAHGAGVVRDAAEKIDHSLPPAAPIAAAPTADYGRYVAQLCVGCHGQEWKGGHIPGTPPDWPDAAQLAGRGSVIDRYSDAEQFKALLRTRVRPDGSSVSTRMPTNVHLSDTDLEAMFLFFKSTAATGTSAP